VDPCAPWYAAAVDILAESGYGALKLAPLCRRVGVSTGPFYYVFGSWQQFTGQFLEHWHTVMTRDHVELARAQADALDRLQVLIDAAVGLPHSAEAAIRAWSTVDPRVTEVLRQVDAERLAIGQQAFAELLTDDEAARFATVGMDLLIGFQLSSLPRHPDRLRWSLEQLKQAAVARALQR